MAEQRFTKEKTEFFILTSLTIILSSLDIIFTYMGTPDLSLEANPLVYTLNFGWGGLILANLVLICIYILSSFYSYIKFKPETIQCGSFKEYYSMLYLDRPIWMLHRLPQKKRAYAYIWACIGYIISITLPLIRLRAVLEWILYLSNENLFYYYCAAIEKIGFNTFLGRFDYFIMVISTVIFLLIYWIHMQYSNNKKAIKRQNNS